jgi:DMSO/TMAO reductase YedYZ molybdopterin-dependent catalytic subunit
VEIQLRALNSPGVPTKLGFKNPKHIMALFVTNDYPGGYWEDQGYNWFSGS